MSTVDRETLLAELGITADLQGRLDRIAAQLRTASEELSEARERSEPGSDTEARLEEALAGLEDVLRLVEWRAPGPDGEEPS